MTSRAVSFAGHAFGRRSRPDCPVAPARTRQPTSWAVILTVLVCLVTHTLAAAPDAAAPVETLAVNHRRPSAGGRRWAVPQRHEFQGRVVQRRDETTDTPEPSATSASQSLTATFSIGVGSAKPTSSSTSASASPLPSIFDSLSSDFAPGPDGGDPPCPKFINSFLNDPTFKQCYPLSMLFDRSQSFFEAQRSLVGITRTLDATCAANPTSCNDYMAQLASDFIAPENCGVDYELDLPSVVEAHIAMRAYAPVYSAGCLKDPDTAAYCYASAVTNLTNPSTTYFYFLPLNKTLPGTTVPACNYCLRQTMALYRAATADRAQLIANTYVAAAKQVNTICGPTFVDESLAPPATSAARRAVPLPPPLRLSPAWLAALPLVAFLWAV